MKLFSRIQNVWANVWMDAYSRSFIQHNRSVWKDTKIAKPESEVLVAYSAISSWLVSVSYFANVLARKHQAKILAFSSTKKSFPWSLLYWKRDAIYRSFNTSAFLRVTLNAEQRARRDQIVRDCLKTIKTKKDLYGFSFQQLSIGVDIYETYLRICSRPTVDLKDPALHQIITEGVGIAVFWDDYVKHHQVKAIVVSHDAYIHENILCKIGYRDRIPVYSPNVRGICFAQKPYSVTNPLFKDYPAMFAALSEEERTQGLQLAQRQLDRRLSGEVGVDMGYSLKSAFAAFDENKRVLKKSDKIKVLICSHCFYDNPQAYGDMFFMDFYDWLCFLGEISQRTDYDWYIKMHPDPLPGTEEIIRGIIAKYPKITFIPPQTSHKQLKAEGINFVLTAYGSVGHELAALGIQVINAGYNPHIAYNFNWHPKSLQEYEQLLMGLNKLEKEINKNEIYEFYYMHYYYTIVDDLFLKSYREYTQWAKTQPEAAVYEYFLNHFTHQKHQQILQRLEAFIDSKAVYCLKNVQAPEDRTVYEKHLS